MPDTESSLCTHYKASQEHCVACAPALCTNNTVTTECALSHAEFIWRTDTEHIVGWRNWLCFWWIDDRWSMISFAWRIIFLPKVTKSPLLVTGLPPLLPVTPSMSMAYSPQSWHWHISETVMEWHQARLPGLCCGNVICFGLWACKQSSKTSGNPRILILHGVERWILPRLVLVFLLNCVVWILLRLLFGRGTT